MLETGYIPPQAVQIEESLLGAILISGTSLDTELFLPEAFYVEKNRIIASAINSMTSVKENIDILSVSEKLKKTGELEAIGGMEALTSLIDKIEPAGDLASYEKIIYEKFMLRELIRISDEISREAYQDDGDPFTLASKLQTMTAKLLGFKSENIQHIREGIKQLYKLIERNISGKTELTGMPSGLVDLDRFTNGFQKSDLIVIGGEQSNGKTALALKCALTPALTGHKVVIYSYEMSMIQLAARFTAMISGLSAKAMQYRKLDDYEINQVSSTTGKLENTELYIDTIPDSSYEHLERSIRVMVQKNGMELIIIDYLQLIRHSVRSGNHAQAVAEIANNLKSLSKVLDVPIILLSQLSRDKSNPKPMLPRLKGSGDIEGAADVVILVWRPEIYGIQNFECKYDTYPSAGLSHLIVAKGRNIGITEMVLRFTGKTTLFSDYEQLDADAPY